MDFRSAILRTLCFHAAWHYAPTAAELMLTLDVGIGAQNPAVVLSGGPSDGPEPKDLSRQNALDAISQLERDGLISEGKGRFGLTEELSIILDAIRERDLYQPRKRRRAARVAKWLASLGSVRFIALANTTALGNARDAGDLDFFVVAKRGTVWSTRLLGAGPFKLLGRLPTEDRTRDAVCLSYFVSEDGLKLAPHMLAGDDPYFRYWFLSLLPLFDDGVGERLWSENSDVIARHPFARRWLVPPDLRLTTHDSRLPTSFCRIIEPAARSFQQRWFPKMIKELMNRDSRVIVDDRTLKFHVDDRRAAFRDTYQDLCRKYGITS